MLPFVCHGCGLSEVHAGLVERAKGAQRMARSTICAQVYLSMAHRRTQCVAFVCLMSFYRSSELDLYRMPIRSLHILPAALLEYKAG
jgi:hypothetical protein